MLDIAITQATLRLVVEARPLKILHGSTVVRVHIDTTCEAPLETAHYKEDDGFASYHEQGLRFQLRLEDFTAGILDISPIEALSYMSRYVWRI